MKPASNSFLHHSIRLKGYDYSQAGAYFITTVTNNRECQFGKIVNGEMVLNKYGLIVEKEWRKTPEIRKKIELDTFMVMPNHLHGIIVISPPVPATCRSPLHSKGPKPNSLGAIIAGFKAAVTKQINTIRGIQGVSVWQRNYHDHIIRNEDELMKIREYLINNPAKWELDRENPFTQPDQKSTVPDEPWLS